MRSILNNAHKAALIKYTVKYDLFCIPFRCFKSFTNRPGLMLFLLLICMELAQFLIYTSSQCINIKDGVGVRVLDCLSDTVTYMFGCHTTKMGIT